MGMNRAKGAIDQIRSEKRCPIFVSLGTYHLLVAGDHQKRVRGDPRISSSLEQSFSILSKSTFSVDTKRNYSQSRTKSLRSLNEN